MFVMTYMWVVVLVENELPRCTNDFLHVNLCFYVHDFSSFIQAKWHITNSIFIVRGSPSPNQRWVPLLGCSLINIGFPARRTLALHLTKDHTIMTSTRSRARCSLKIIQAPWSFHVFLLSVRRGIFWSGFLRCVNEVFDSLILCSPPWGSFMHHEKEDVNPSVAEEALPGTLEE